MAISLTIKIGQGIQIGDDTVIRIDQKSGQTVKVSIASPRGPIVVLAGKLAPSRDGEMRPKRFTTGISGRIEPVEELDPA